MTVVDPRDRNDDLLVASRHEQADPAMYDDLVRSETALAGWLVLAFVFDRDGRLLLVEAPWTDEPSLPSAVPALSESIADAVCRGVHEDAGLDVTPVRPLAVEDTVVESDATGETAEWTTVCYEAAPTSPAGTEGPTTGSPTTGSPTTGSPTTGSPTTEGPASEGSATDGPASGVELHWTDHLPDGLHDADLTARVYARCRSNHDNDA